jgi:outer membrane protein OmpA-like peptidoglycan-associated protein
MMSEGHVRDLFADVLAAFPPTPQRFTLYFRFESEELTPESRARIPDIVGAVRNYPAPEVVVIGHTDTTGAPDRNYQLGLRRARTVRDILAATQVEGAAITVSSHGEADPLVPTRDEVLEPRNRRVEITVR